MSGYYGQFQRTLGELSNIFLVQITKQKNYLLFKHLAYVPKWFILKGKKNQVPLRYTARLLNRNANK